MSWLKLTILCFCALSCTSYSDGKPAQQKDKYIVHVSDIDDVWDDSEEDWDDSPQVVWGDSPQVVRGDSAKAVWSDSPKKNSDEPGDQKYGKGNFEGDIVLNKEQLRIIAEAKKTGKGVVAKRKLHNLALLWPNSRVYYEPPTGVSSTWRNTINDAMAHIEKNTCIKFVASGTAQSRIRFANSDRCSSNLGRQNSVQTVNISSPGCVSRGIVTHELIHALGFHHEQTRQDRDTYITVHYGNIIEDNKHNFDKSDIDDQGMPYDIQSIMQYTRKAFSKNGADTITLKTNEDLSLLGQRDAMSYLDRKIVNKVYGCSDKGVGEDPNRCLWMGTSPFCNGHAGSCTERGLTVSHYDKSGDGAKCWSGNKVCCKGDICTKWKGTAPWCNASAKDCENDGLFFMHYGKYGNGDHCSSGLKACCG